MSAALGALGLAVYLHWRERFLLRAILAGNALAAASCLTHPCGVLYAAGLLLLAIYFDRRRIGWRALACIGLPYIAALSAWGAYILQAPSQFKAQIVGNIGGIGREFTGLNRLAGLTSPLQALKRALSALRLHLWPLCHRFRRSHSALGSPDLRSGRGGLPAHAIHSPASRLSGAAPGGRTRLSGVGHFRWLQESGYLIHTMPLAGAFLAIYTHFLFSRARRPIIAIALAAVMILFTALQCNAISRSLFVTPERWDYENAVAFLRRAGARSGIIAAAEFAFALGFDSDMVDYLRLGYFSGRATPIHRR